MDSRLSDVLHGREDNYLFPFYWQRGDHRDRIPAQIARIRDSGCRALCVESRPHPDFCGEGWWRVFWFWRSRRGILGGRIDPLSRESCPVLLEAVYEPHYAHYGDLFGSVIAGFFSDEPQFHNWLVGGHLHDDGLYTYSVGQEGLALPYSDALAAPDRMPDFAGKARYAFAADFTADDLALDWTLDLGRVGQTARLFVNGADAGIRIAPPYRFSLRGRLVAGRNEFVVETASTLARKVKDDLSFFLPIPPEGLLGPIRLQS